MCRRRARRDAGAGRSAGVDEAAANWGGESVECELGLGSVCGGGLVGGFRWCDSGLGHGEERAGKGNGWIT